MTRTSETKALNGSSGLSWVARAPRTREKARCAAAGRRVHPQCRELEGRVLQAVTGLIVEASPVILLHPTQRDQPRGIAQERVVPVTIEGSVATSGPALPTVQFRVIDEYGPDQPHGVIGVQPIQPGGFLYTTRIGLVLSRHRNDLDGRQYTILVTAADGHTSQTAGTVVTVPHTRLEPGAIGRPGPGHRHQPDLRG